MEPIAPQSNVAYLRTVHNYFQHEPPCTAHDFLRRTAAVRPDADLKPDDIFEEWNKDPELACLMMSMALPAQYKPPLKCLGPKYEKLYIKHKRALLNAIPWEESGYSTQYPYYPKLDSATWDVCVHTSDTFVIYESDLSMFRETTCHSDAISTKTLHSRGNVGGR